MSETFKSYDELKEEYIHDIKRGANRKIPLLANALHIENPRITKAEIKDIIVKDLQEYVTRRTIMDALGDEYKDLVKQEAGKKGADIKKKEKENKSAAIISATTSGGTTLVHDDSQTGGKVDGDENSTKDNKFVSVEDMTLEPPKSKDIQEINQKMQEMQKQMDDMQEAYKAREDSYKRTIEKEQNRVIGMEKRAIKAEEELNKMGKGGIPLVQEKWALDGGPEPDDKMDWFGERVTLGDVLKQLRLVLSSCGKRTLVSARIMVTKPEHQWANIQPV